MNLTEPREQPTAPSPLPRKRLWAVFVTVIALTALGFFALGRLSTAPALVPDSGADAGFARDMQTHHAQAVEMALLIRDKSDDPEIRAVAYDIATAQQHQNGQMFAWLQDWGLTQAGTAPPMAWMTAGGTHDGTGASHGTQGAGTEDVMEGMATPEQMQALRETSGAEADRLFTDLMIRHHQGGVAMASAGTRLAETSKVRDFAARIVEAQTAEITALEELRGRL
ncbi:DUF305 domain-containing protein [Pseudarthrobacter cellobiosi]|uniref:DUF305 domain-containing protein n=1 Tax=Pseudarthrobacter cellobiosi TaxID=2953654 RepID=UPI00208EF9AF|nr:DUF305 domain-containing protein [Pseudarthrobacter sp. HLT1-5]MCO4254499.1 DUF305 domain-containing protein [Pseudarthrobacter sp. HLT1-5]